MTPSRQRGRFATRGFTLVEVMVAVLVVALGVLGLAKMQALAVSGTKISSSRSLIALQAESLAAIMHANTAFWGVGAGVSFSSAGATITTDSSGVLGQAVATSCASTASTPTLPLCTNSTMAAYDVQNWIAGMNSQFPTNATKVNCSGGGALPVSCMIYISWIENTVAVNQTEAQQVSNGGATSTQTFSIYVKP